VQIVWSLKGFAVTDIYVLRKANIQVRLHKALARRYFILQTAHSWTSCLIRSTHSCSDSNC